jgi:predicted nucleic acid-binding protein
MRSVVVDTSALIRLFVPDGPVPDGLEALLADAERGDVVVEMPELAWAEVVEVLRKKESRGLLDAETVDAITETLMHLPIRFVSHRELIQDALRIARSNALTVYDSLFFALATARRGGLVTADDRLARAFAAR